MSMIDWRPARAARHVRDVEVCLGPAARPADEQGGDGTSVPSVASAFHYAAWAPDASSPTGWTLLHASELAPRDTVDGAVAWAPWPAAAAARLPTAAAAARCVHVHVCGARTCAETMAPPPPAPPAPPCGGDRGRCGGGCGNTLCLAATLVLDAGAPCDAPLTVPGSVAVRLAGVGRVVWVPESVKEAAATEEADTPPAAADPLSSPSDDDAPTSSDDAPTSSDDPWAAAALTRRAAGGLAAARARASAAAAALEAAAGDETQAAALAAAETQADACNAMAAAAEARASAAREATTALRETTLRRARSLAAASTALAAADADLRRMRATLLPRARAGAQAAAAALVARRCALVAGVGAALAIAPTPGDVAARPATGFPWDALDAGWTGGGGSGAGSRGARSEAGAARPRGPPSLAASAPPLAPPTPSASSVTSGPVWPAVDAAAAPPPPRLTIAGLAADTAPAPAADAAAVDAAAAGALAAAVAAIAAVTAVPLRHPLRVCGSTSGARARPPPAGTARARAAADGVGDAVGAALLLPGAPPRALLAATGRRGVATPGDDLDPGAAAAAADAAAGAPPEFRLAPFRGADGDRAAADGRRAAYGAFLLYRDVVQLLDAHGLAVPAGGRDAALAGVHKLVAAARAAAAER